MAVLSIAGSSPDGGAGIQMDMKVFDALGTTGATIVTALTSQNTRSIKGVWWVPPPVILSQLKSVFSDMSIKAVKIGMAGQPEVAKTIYDYLKDKKIPIVLDPVMGGQADGRSLFEDGSLQYMKKLISISEIVVPNAEEAETITGLEVNTVSDAEEAASRIQKMGAKAVLVTGIKTGVISDVFKYDFKFTYTKQIRVGGTKGGGCCLSSAIAAFRSQGISVPSSVEHAEGFVDAAIAHKKKIGRGIHSLDPLSTLRKDSDRYSVLCNLKAGLTMIETHNEFAPFIPEVGTNIVYAIRGSRTPHDVAGVVGKIRDAMGVPSSLGTVEFGASLNLSKAVLEATAVDPEKRSVLNMLYVPKLETASRKAGFSTGQLGSKTKDVDWSKLKNSKKKIPDVIFHKCPKSIEKCAYVFGNDAIDSVTKALKIVATSFRNSGRY